MAGNSLPQEWLVQLIVLFPLSWKREVFGWRKKKTFQTLSIATVQWESLNPCWHHLMQKYHYKDTELLPKDIEGFIYPLLQVVGMLQMQINLKNMY